MLKMQLIKPLPIPKIMELTDIIHLTNRNGDPIIECRICGSISGTIISEFTHMGNCKYFVNRERSIIKYKKVDVVLKNEVESHSIFPIYQKEVHIATPEHPIIGTYSLGPCVCIIMRDPITTKTMLAHIDSNTIDPLRIFDMNFVDSSKIDLYIVGGDNSSDDLTSSLLDKLELLSLLDNNSNKDRYNIKLVWLIDWNSNDVSIDSRNGDIYLNLGTVSNFMEIPLRMSIDQILTTHQLYQINVPIHKNICIRISRVLTPLILKVVKAFEYFQSIYKVNKNDD
jgi:hypothetical protein